MIHCHHRLSNPSFFKAGYPLAAAGIALLLILAWPAPGRGNPQETSALMFKAIQLSLKGKNEEALAILQEIARKEPKNFYAYNNIALVYTELKDYDNALKFYETSLSLNPVFPMTLNNIGNLHLTLGNYEKAEGYLKRALAQLKTFPEASINLGELYLRQKRYDEAMKYLKQALADMPGLPRPHQLLGQVYRELGREEAAKKEDDLYEKLRHKPDKN